MTCHRLRNPSPSATPHYMKKAVKSHQRSRSNYRAKALLRVYLIALRVEIKPSDPGVAGLSEANELLRSVPFEHSHTAVLSTRHVCRTPTRMRTTVTGATRLGWGRGKGGVQENSQY